MNNPIPPNVAEAYARHDASTHTVLMELRDLIFEAARELPEVGAVEETLKWGEPSYLTPQTKSGSTIRLGKSKATDGAAIFVHCQSNLAEQFQTHYGDELNCDGKRAVYVDKVTDDNRAMLKHCLALALTYHLNKRKSSSVS